MGCVTKGHVQWAGVKGGQGTRVGGLGVKKEW